MIDGILWVLSTGSPWRDVPEEFGPWKTVWDHFDKWNDSGLLDSILNRLRASHVEAGTIDDELWCVDGTIVRAARCAAGGEKKETPRNRQIMRWAAGEAVFPQKSTCSATATATPSTSTSRRVKPTSRKV